MSGQISRACSPAYSSGSSRGKARAAEQGSELRARVWRGRGGNVSTLQQRLAEQFRTANQACAAIILADRKSTAVKAR